MGVSAILSSASLVFAAFWLIIWYQTQKTLARIQVSGRDANDISLTRSPTRLSSFELISITFAILKKYVFVYTGKAARLRADPKRDQVFVLPSITVRGFIEISDDDFKKFRNAVPVGTTGSMDMNMINPFFLIATTGPLIPFILAHPNCPIKPLGAVNTRNIFVTHNAEFCRNVQAIKVASDKGQLSYTASFGGPDRPGYRRQRGVEFTITVNISWNGETVLSQELSFLQFLSSSTLPKFKRHSTSDQGQTRLPDPSDAPDSQAKDLDLSMNLKHPRTWAACCRDYNPIHISTVMAKLFGFKSVIAHGNHAVALVMQQLYNNSSHGEDHVKTFARRSVWESTKPVTIEVKFVKPMVLPVLARVHWSKSKEQTTRADFEILRGTTKYTVGSCSI